MCQHNHLWVMALWADPSEQFAAMFVHVPAHEHPHKSFVIPKVAAVMPLHRDADCSCYQRDRKWDLWEYINLHRSAKYSSNFTPEWIKTWPFIFAGDSENLTAYIQPLCIRHMFPIFQQSVYSGSHLFCANYLIYFIKLFFLKTSSVFWCHFTD